MEELLPGVDRAPCGASWASSTAAHAETREERLGYGLRGGALIGDDGQPGLGSCQGIASGI